MRPGAHPRPSPFEALARARKAQALAAVASEVGMTADQVVRVTAYQRTLLAELASVRLPSDETWAAVVALLRAREALAARLAVAVGEWA